ncbi:hypothetical protein M899_1910 [Bacteriovorax sp. BSW11_IV]|uniref:hypothetical protein n=1 Tax=Bacteriovorax sp. BSW11_IV TaxID=1353529 RepID=UPI00038A1891|nr:hypothetical protein [Bacteriovorax sp. BSW11_IV]EQC48433.1 hypothetical protein M899_1910 [Bacteriovorax sp. BSW11_IV]
MIRLIILSLLTAHSSFAFECNKDDKTYIQEAIKLDFSGSRINRNENSVCLKQKNFKYIVSVFEPSNEIHNTEKYIVDDFSTLKIETPKLIDKDVEVYEVEFSYMARKAGMTKTEPTKIHDKMRYFKNTSTKSSKEMGCIGVIETPTQFTLLKDCVAK